MNTSALTTMQRKAGADRPPPEFGVMSPAKALRLALAKSGEECLSVNIMAGTVEERRLTLGGINEVLQPGSLAVVLEHLGGGRGLAVLDAGAVAAVIEAMTTGQITKGTPSDPPRQPTSTDAFLAGRFLSQALSALAANLVKEPEGQWVAGYSAGTQLKDERAIPLMLSDTAYQTIAAPVEFNGGARAGRLEFILPWVPLRPAVAAAPALPAPSEAKQSDAAPVSPQEALMQGQVTLEAVLHRVRLSLNEIASWKTGDTLPFPIHAIGTVAVLDAAGEQIATARLGQARGQRALKLSLAEMPKFDTLEALAVGGNVALSDFGDVGGLEDDALPAASEPDTPEITPGFSGIPDLDAEEDGEIGGGEFDLPDLPPLDIDMDSPGELPELPDLPPIIE